MIAECGEQKAEGTSQSAEIDVLPTAFCLVPSAFSHCVLLKTKTDARRELKIMNGVAGNGYRYGGEIAAENSCESCERSLPVPDNSVARIEACEDAARNIKLKHAADV